MESVHTDTVGALERLWVQRAEKEELSTSIVLIEIYDFATPRK